MQQLTAALSPQGIKNFVGEIITKLMAGSFTAPDQPDVVKDQGVPLGLCNMQVDSISLSGGSVTSMAATLQDVTQKSDGLFTVSLNASFDVAYAEWSESGSITCPSGSPHSRPVKDPFDLTLSGFSFTIDSIDLSFDVQIAQSGGSFTASVSNAAESGVDVGAVKLPPDSNLHHPSLFGCINDRIDDAVKKAIAHVDFAKALQGELQTLLATIPNSGNIGHGIVYEFAPQTVTFPGDSGIVGGVNGQVVANGVTYPVAPPADIPLPAIVPTLDFVANVGTFELDALLWAFYQAGALQVTVTSGMVPNAQYLNTAFYESILPALYDFAPDAPMEVQVAAAQPPTVNDAPLYMVTAQALAALAGKLPAAVLADLRPLKDVPHPDIPSFNHAVTTQVGESNAQEYGPAILAASTEIGFYVDSTWNLTVNVMKCGSAEEAFVMQVTKNDLLTNFALQAQGTVQTLTFVFNELATTETLTSSNVAGLKTDTLKLIWFIVDGLVDQMIQASGNKGVPLPFVRGFLFEDAVITLQAAYVTVGSNVRFDSETSAVALSPAAVAALTDPVPATA